LSIKVGGLEYTVEILDPNIPNPALIMGFTEFEQNRIGLKSGMSPDREEWVLWHEITHAMIEMFPPTLSEEELVGLMAERLYGVLQENNLLRDGWFDGIVDSRSGTRMPNRSGKVVIDEDDTAVHKHHESVRDGDHAEEISSSGGTGMGRHSE
jgi:hypothetical protein